ncbi:anchored cell wall protein-5 [Diaporthe helianthi]|uniref:Anchored cell wall protein-5 n=1 Tax=Diaporthe helianthi TaxID=158607 RepID=A0A2P5HMD2_DIAHE|nr:anchored cell wall protein-5 [Diaporthe helianthi]
MKASLVAVAALAGLASSQCVSSIPECAQDCLVIAAGSVGCGETDYTCQCTSQHQTDITTNATTCVLAACGQQIAINEVLPAAAAFCSSINAGGSCSSASAGVTSSGTSSASGSTSSQDSTLPTSVSQTGTGTEATTTTGRSSSASGTAETTGSSATDASATATSTAAAAAAKMGSVGSLGMAVLGALVIL